MKPKENRKNDNKHLVAVFDECQTPPYVVDPLLPFLHGKGMIWESASGLGILADALRERGGLNVIATGLPEHDYFEYEPWLNYAQVTNPPYSIKYDWLRKAYERGKPFALLMPVEMAGAGEAADLFGQYGIEIMYLRPRVDFVMPRKEVYGNGAQFPVAWYCWKLLPSPVMWRKLDKWSRSTYTAWWEGWKDSHQDAYWSWWQENAFPIGTRVVFEGRTGYIVQHVPRTALPYQVYMEDHQGDVRCAGWHLKELR